MVYTFISDFIYFGRMSKQTGNRAARTYINTGADQYIYAGSNADQYPNADVYTYANADQYSNTDEYPNSNANQYANPNPGSGGGSYDDW